MVIRVGLVGAGKIARDQHVPAIRAHDGFELVAVADPSSRLEEVANFLSLEAMLGQGPPIDAVVLCTPPQGRYRLALQALEAGKHVMLEKPPAASLAEMAILQASRYEVAPFQA